MLNGRKPINTARVRPLLFDCCRCGLGRTLVCLACQRWLRHYRQVTERRAAFGGSQ
jgi:hypothetical protein